MKTIEQELIETREYHIRQLAFLEEEIRSLKDILQAKISLYEEYRTLISEYDTLLNGQSIPWLL